jgi:hypothetical protein
MRARLSWQPIRFTFSRIRETLGGALSLCLPPCANGSTAGGPRFPSGVSRARTQPFISGLAVKAATALPWSRHLAAAFLA